MLWANTFTACSSATSVSSLRISRSRLGNNNRSNASLRQILRNATCGERNSIPSASTSPVSVGLISVDRFSTRGAACGGGIEPGGAGDGTSTGDGAGVSGGALGGSGACGGSPGGVIGAGGSLGSVSGDGDGDGTSGGAVGGSGGGT